MCNIISLKYNKRIRKFVRDNFVGISGKPELWHKGSEVVIKISGIKNPPTWQVGRPIGITRFHEEKLLVSPVTRSEDSGRVNLGWESKWKLNENWLRYGSGKTDKTGQFRIKSENPNHYSLQ